ncbi:hypothetical protein KY285_024456 [Solanum tuberosum]|nr:hypothetical protein KY285_024456 [Solanum tuberosum]
MKQPGLSMPPHTLGHQHCEAYLSFSICQEKSPKSAESCLWRVILVNGFVFHPLISP